MVTLSKELRRQLESTVLKAREEAERGAAAALESYGVAEAKLPGHLDEAGKVLRRKLRAHGRQVGDVRRPDDSQEVEHLIHECAYENWHRMLFARFLAENGFLIEPESGLDVDFAHCEEEAKRLGIDPLELAARFAQRMLPAIFRPDDPVLQLRLPAESRGALTALLASLPRDVFLADDSLGWVYQFWQTKKKKEVNDSGVKIGADELSPVTQLFTEDYMVEFLLHNTLGAWWTAKRRAEGKSQPIAFAYLRLKEDGTPAAGAFAGWPKTVKELRVLDPCMGSGHFLAFALVILVRMRMEEEGLTARDACVAVLHDNLFGLELDPRCTQIAAFNLALAAWKLGGYHAELPLNLACSGLGLHAKKDDWLKLAERAAQTNALAADNDLLGAREETLLSQKLKAGMERLYDLFQRAPVLGSLINPRALGSDWYVAEFHELQPLLAKALERETGDEAHELAVTAQGAAKAAEILASQFTLVVTNVPYLGSGKQDDILKDYCERAYPEAKTDLATCFVERCLAFCLAGGSTALVTPQNWLFLTTYKKLRTRLLKGVQWDLVARLGEGGFESPQAAGAFTAMLSFSSQTPAKNHVLAGFDVIEENTPSEKDLGLCSKPFVCVAQLAQLDNPDARVSFEEPSNIPRLERVASCLAGILNGDSPRFQKYFWEFGVVPSEWCFQQSTVETTQPYGGRELVIFFDEAGGHLREDAAIRRDRLHDSDRRGNSAWKKWGVAVSQMRELLVTIYSGEKCDSNAAVICPMDQRHVCAIWAFCSSPDFNLAVRKIDQKVNVTNATIAKIPFDLAHWEKVAAEKYPDGLPKPFSSDPTQWLFNGHPKSSDHPLQVAVARLVGYRWPRQTGSSFPDCPALGSDGLEKHADNDGVVCFSQARDEAPAAQRLRALLVDAFGAEWSHAMERKLIAATGSKAESLEEWLVNDFFAQHCDLFHNRPFVWHIWDGRKDGFNVLVNYHKLAGPKGDGHRTLETLTHAYLGDWITRQKDAVAHNEAGADDRFAAAQELQGELINISAGEPPYDLFIRWKPLHQQPEGWYPDINDGVRLNIRPFMVATLSRGKKGCGLFRTKPGNSVKWEKDRGNDTSRSKRDYPWFWKWDQESVDFEGDSDFDGNRWNDCHYTNEFKRAARNRTDTNA
ncbi:MAG: SAM-dependent DNA methyltransferase [Verrucomicrobiota bacterium]